MDFWIWYYSFTKNIEMMKEAVTSGVITKAQYKEITGLDY